MLILSNHTLKCELLLIQNMQLGPGWECACKAKKDCADSSEHFHHEIKLHQNQCG